MAACYDVPGVTQSINRKLREMTASHFSNAVYKFGACGIQHIVLHNPSQLEHLC